MSHFGPRSISSIAITANRIFSRSADLSGSITSRSRLIHVQIEHTRFWLPSANTSSPVSGMRSTTSWNSSSRSASTLHLGLRLPQHLLGTGTFGYRFVAGHLADVTSREELTMIEEAARDSRFAGVSAHIDRALELYADRENPDYRNSIKESISAVESMARLVSGSEKATLGDALKTIEKNGHLHPALKEGFLKLYGYTSDEQGIRHAMLDEPNLTAADARYFLVSCSSFVNYLKAQIQ